eukprot:CAMPEP_0196998526 /NCGR_PEP_ID=MMETSP1380-20130617/3892_1 /TAXON_ID=5936 /ORGANISM="Euplotes crassus, Strain CT5" /LENGTH=190 /DNA_ID=CAMNT_0042415129 /DNA_START=33 /DNA_END=605 /DNA_ORIENTATION=-
MNDLEPVNSRSFYAQSQKVVPKVLDMADDEFYGHKKTNSQTMTHGMRPRVKWSSELEKVKVFRKVPTERRVQLLQIKAIRTNRVPGKSILKTHTMSISQSEEYDMSSSTSISDDGSPAREVRIPPPRRRLHFGVSPAKKAITTSSGSISAPKPRKKSFRRGSTEKLKKIYNVDDEPTKPRVYRSPTRFSK